MKGEVSLAVHLQSIVFRGGEYRSSAVLLQLIHLNAIGFSDERNSLHLLLRCFV